MQEGGGTGGFASCRFVSLGHHRSGAREAGNLAGIYSRSRAAGYVSGSVDDARAYPRSGMPRRGHPGWPCGVRPTQPTLPGVPDGRPPVPESWKVLLRYRDPKSRAGQENILASFPPAVGRGEAATLLSKGQYSTSPL